MRTEDAQDMSRSDLLAVLLLVIELIKSNDKDAAIAKLSGIVKTLK